MGTISLTNIANGDSLDATTVDNNFDTIASEINGGLDSDNIESNSLTYAKIKADGFTTYDVNAQGFSAVSTDNFEYVKIGRLIIGWVIITGTSNATTLTFTLPYAASVGSGGAMRAVLSRVRDNTADVADPGYIELSNGSTTATAYKTLASGAWTNEGTKELQAMLVYQSAS